MPASLRMGWVCRRSPQARLRGPPTPSTPGCPIPPSVLLDSDDCIFPTAIAVGLFLASVVDPPPNNPRPLGGKTIISSLPPPIVLCTSNAAAISSKPSFSNSLPVIHHTYMTYMK